MKTLEAQSYTFQVIEGTKRNTKEDMSSRGSKWTKKRAVGIEMRIIEQGSPLQALSPCLHIQDFQGHHPTAF